MKQDRTITYNEAVDTIIEHTEIGYTLASQDKVWIVFTFDLNAEGDYAAFRYNRLYPLVRLDNDEMGGWSYELLMLGGERERGVPVFLNRVQAERFADDLRAHIKHKAGQGHTALHGQDGEEPQVYVMNLGDDARYEKTIIGPDGGTHPRTTPKFKGSEAAWQAMTEMTQRWREANR